MYLDNILISKSADTSVSYSEILMDCIETSEAICASEAYAISSEFAKHTLGSEAASDWWPKIKAFFKKIWEALKRLFAKVVAWIAALPDKIVALCKKIYALWVKRGLEGKMKNLRKNIQKKVVGLNAESAKDFENTDWGIQDAVLIRTTWEQMTTKFKNEKGKDLISKILGGGLTREVIRESVGALAHGYAELHNDESETASNAKEGIKEVCDDIRTAIEQANEEEYKYNDILANLESWYNDIKNDTFSKEFKKAAKFINVSIEVMDKMHEKAYKEFETLYKNDDEDGAKMLTLELKGINVLTQAAIYAEGFLSRLFATAALNRAKMVIAAIKCFDAEGAKNGDSKLAEGSDTKSNIVKDPAKQKNTPPTPKASKPKGISKGDEPEITPIDFEAMQAERDKDPSVINWKKKNGIKSEFSDPDFIAFMKM